MYREDSCWTLEFGVCVCAFVQAWRETERSRTRRRREEEKKMEKMKMTPLLPERQENACNNRKGRERERHTQRHKGHQPTQNKRKKGRGE